MRPLVLSGALGICLAWNASPALAAAEAAPHEQAPVVTPPREPSPANSEDGGPLPQDPADRSGLPMPGPTPDRRDTERPAITPTTVPTDPDPGFGVQPSALPAPEVTPSDLPKPGLLPSQGRDPLKR